MAAKKKPYVPSKWSYIKPKEDERRKLTLFVAGALPEHLDLRLDKLTANYDVITVMCAGEWCREKNAPPKEVNEKQQSIQNWAHSRRQHYGIIPWKDLNTLSGEMQFIQSAGNKAVIVYDDGSDTDEVKFAKSLSKEPDVQYKKIDVTIK